MKRAGLLAAALAVLAPAGVLAQFSPGARSVGMGGAGMVFSSGVDAIEWNPANLALDGGWNVSVGEVGVAALLSGVTFEDLQDIVDVTARGREGMAVGVENVEDRRVSDHRSVLEAIHGLGGEKKPRGRKLRSVR